MSTINALNNWEWDKYGKVEKDNRRIAIPVSPEMEKLIALFKNAYPDRKFSDAKVIGTFVEAGARAWVGDFYAKRQAAAVDQEAQ